MAERWSFAKVSRKVFQFRRTIVFQSGSTLRVTLRPDNLPTIPNPAKARRTLIVCVANAPVRYSIFRIVFQSRASGRRDFLKGARMAYGFWRKTSRFELFLPRNRADRL